MKVIAYIRVSTTSQAVSGLGMDAQRTTIQQAADRHGWTITEWLEDPAQSGKNTDRPGLTLARQMLKAGLAECLVVAKLDRLSRSVLDFATIAREAQEQGWNIRVLDIGLDLATPYGKMVAQMLAVFAEFEREIISIRLKEAFARYKADASKPPLGRKPVDVDPTLLERIVELHQQTPKPSLSAIARQLTADGIPLISKKNGHWTSMQVKRLLERITA